MNHQIFKYNLPLTNEIIELEVPINHEFCDIQAQRGDIVMWLLINSNEELYIKRFKIIGTGEYIFCPDDYGYLKTVQMPNGLAWHVFEMNE